MIDHDVSYRTVRRGRLEMKVATDRTDPQGPVEVCLTAIGVTYPTASGSIKAVTNVDLICKPSSFTCIVGPSGCGKSTLLTVVAGLRRPTVGVVTVHGDPVSGPVQDLGFVFQRDLLLEWRTVLDNVLLQVELRGWPAKKYRNRAVHLLELVGLSDFLQRYPRELSGGMRQRVAICRALIHQPRVLLMDEPFGSVDAITREQLNVDVAKICEGSGATTLFVTHSIDEAAFLGDSIVVMSPRPGTIVGRIDVALPRPRETSVRSTEAFFSYMRAARAILERDAGAHS
jgi:NitT/TauT family transport system ATP-binding protein